MTILCTKMLHSQVVTIGYNNSNNKTTIKTATGTDPRYVAVTIGVTVVGTKTVDIGDTKVIDIGAIITITTVDIIEETITTTINKIGIIGSRLLRHIMIAIIIGRRDHRQIDTIIVMITETAEVNDVTTRKIIVSFNRTIMIFHHRRVQRYTTRIHHAGNNS